MCACMGGILGAFVHGVLCVCVLDTPREGCGETGGGSSVAATCNTDHDSTMQMMTVKRPYSHNTEVES